MIHLSRRMKSKGRSKMRRKRNAKNHVLIETLSLKSTKKKTKSHQGMLRSHWRGGNRRKIRMKSNLLVEIRLRRATMAPVISLTICQRLKQIELQEKSRSYKYRKANHLSVELKNHQSGLILQVKCDRSLSVMTNWGIQIDQRRKRW